MTVGWNESNNYDGIDELIGALNSAKLKIAGGWLVLELIPWMSS